MCLQLHGILQRLEKLDEDASNILEVAEDANSAAGSASYDGESLYELMKATVEMFQLDVDVESLHTTLRPASRQGSSSNNGLGNGDENSAEVGVSMSSQPSGYTGDGSSADGRGANRASKAPAMRATSMGVATNISGTDRGCDRSQQPGGSNSDRADVMDDDLPGGGTGALPDASYFGGQ